MSSEQIGAFRRFFAVAVACWRVAFAAGFGLMTALLILRFLDKLVLVGFRDATPPLGRASAEGPEWHDPDVPLPLSGELFADSFAIWSFGRFLLLLLLRLDDELLRFLSLDRFGFASFRRCLEGFREE